MNKYSRFHVLIIPCFAIGIMGCEQNNVDHVRILSAERDRAKVENSQLKTELAMRDQEIAQLNNQVNNISSLGPDRLNHLITVERIELVRLTGGTDFDGETGDDGVTVYVRPVDNEGDTLKAAGSIQVQLLDLTNPGLPREIGLYEVTKPEEIRKHWHGKMMTNHYTIECPWPPGAVLPASGEITIRVTFLDWLTGKELSATKTIIVHPGSGSRVMTQA